jgi:hypothetical protein
MKYKLFFLIVFIMIIEPFVVMADWGPMPSINFNVSYEGNLVPDAKFAATLLSCNLRVRDFEIMSKIEDYKKADNRSAICLNSILKDQTWTMADKIYQCDFWENYSSTGFEDSDFWFSLCQIVAIPYAAPGESVSDLCTKIEKEKRFYTFEDDCKSDNVNVGCRQNNEPYLCNGRCEFQKIRLLDSSKDCFWVVHNDIVWGGECKDSKCFFSKMLPENFRLAVYLPSKDKVFVSDEAVITDMRNSYEANILSNGTLVLREIKPSVQDFTDKSIKLFVIALILTIILEFIAAIIFLVITKTSFRVLVFVPIASLISLPVVWFVFPLIRIPAILIILSAEIFAVLFEGYFIFLFNKKIISLKKSLILSLIINLTSFIIGGFITLFVSFFMSLFS